MGSILKDFYEERDETPKVEQTDDEKLMYSIIRRKLEDSKYDYQELHNIGENIFGLLEFEELIEDRKRKDEEYKNQDWGQFI